MRTVDTGEIIAGLERVAFKDPDGVVHTGNVASYAQYRDALAIIGEMQRTERSKVVAEQREVLTILGFDEAGITAALKLPMIAFFAVVEDFFQKNRRPADAGETPAEPSASPTPGSDSPPEDGD
jgi:hypothetical protein